MATHALTVAFLAAAAAAAAVLPVSAAAGCDCAASEAGRDKAKALPLKIIAIFCILAGSAIGVYVPSLGRQFPALRPGTNVFFAVKAFAGGVILATGFVHVLPDAFNSLTSPCLVNGPWSSFPFAGFVAMLSAIATLMVDTLATGYFQRMQDKKAAAVGDESARDTEASEWPARHGHGHAHGTSVLAAAAGNTDVTDGTQLIRHRVIAQVLELGIIVHSVIIGMALGASDSPNTIRPLVVALTFHQLFEGMGLGGCIVQAKFHLKSVVTMALFFSLTTPVGIVIGIGISSVYNENSPNTLIIQGVLDSAAAGILVYMALVDLLAEDFMKSEVQKSGWLQLTLNISLLFGAGLMSMLAIWA